MTLSDCAAAVVILLGAFACVMLVAYVQNWWRWRG
jgi:hypothetical protein